MRLSNFSSRCCDLLLVCLTTAALLMLAACTKTASPEPPEEQYTPTEFRDCPECPAMIQLPPGQFLMGASPTDKLIDPRTGKPAKNDIPQHSVTIGQPFAIGKFEVTGQEFGNFVAATAYNPQGPCMEFSPPDKFKISEEADWSDTLFPQTGTSPVTCVSYFDALAYTEWLTKVTGKYYRLPTEAEWEYAARAGTTTPYHWGREEQRACEFANVRSPGADTISKRQRESDVVDGFPCDDGFPHSSPVGSFAPNDFGLYDMQGNAWEWVTDCNHKNYEGAPNDGSAWLDDKGCQFGIIRSGSFLNRVERSSTTVRAGRPREGRATNMGFRVVQAEAPAGASEVASGDTNWGTIGTASTDPATRLFDDNCAACHVNREDFRGVYGTDKATLQKVISDGGNNIMSMPAFRDVLTQEEITLLAVYLQEQNGWN